jgi:hypothetical protein
MAQMMMNQQNVMSVNNNNDIGSPSNLVKELSKVMK